MRDFIVFFHLLTLFIILRFLFQVYVLWLHVIFLTLFPSLLLFRLNKTIHRKLSENISSVRRTSHETLRRRELRLARVSLCIVFLYMACHSPKLVLTMCEIVYQDTKVGKGSKPRCKVCVVSYYSSLNKLST